MATIGYLHPPRPPRLVGEVHGTGQFPNELVGALSYWFRVTQKYREPISLELHDRRGLHAFLMYLASGVYPFSGLECLTLIGVNQDRTVHLLHS